MSVFYRLLVVEPTASSSIWNRKIIFSSGWYDDMVVRKYFPVFKLRVRPSTA